MTITAPPRQRAPWPLQVAAWSWLLAGIALALAPAVTVLLLWLQYRGLLRDAGRAADLVEWASAWLDRAGVAGARTTVDTDRVREVLTQVDAFLTSTPAWVWIGGALIYALLAAVALVLYGVTVRGTLRARQWARVLGTVLAALATPPLIAWWWFVLLPVAWLPLTAMSVAHVAPAACALHALGVVCAWLPPANRAVRATRAR